MSLLIILLILESNGDWMIVFATGMIIFLKNRNYICSFKLAGKIPIENDKLAISDIGLLKDV